MSSSPNPALDLLWHEINVLQDFRIRRYSCGSESGNRVYAEIDRQIMDLMAKVDEIHQVLHEQAKQPGLVLHA